MRYVWGEVCEGRLRLGIWRDEVCEDEVCGGVRWVREVRVWRVS